MPLLKGIVIALGVLIVAGMGLLAYGLATKTRTAVSPTSGLPSASTKPSAAGFGTLSVPVPKGCGFATIVADGERAYLRLAPVDAGAPARACERVIVLDVARGQVMGTIVPVETEPR
jgi:hypothetical protein